MAKTKIDGIHAHQCGGALRVCNRIGAQVVRLFFPFEESLSELDETVTQELHTAGDDRVIAVHQTLEVSLTLVGPFCGFIDLPLLVLL